MFPSRASDISSIDNHRGHRYQFVPAIQTLNPFFAFSNLQPYKSEVTQTWVSIQPTLFVQTSFTLILRKHLRFGNHPHCPQSSKHTGDLSGKSSGVWCYLISSIHELKFCAVCIHWRSISASLNPHSTNTHLSSSHKVYKAIYNIVARKFLKYGWYIWILMPDYLPMYSVSRFNIKVLSYHTFYAQILSIRYIVADLLPNGWFCDILLYDIWNEEYTAGVVNVSTSSNNHNSLMAGLFCVRHKDAIQPLILENHKRISRWWLKKSFYRDGVLLKRIF